MAMDKEFEERVATEVAKRIAAGTGLGNYSIDQRDAVRTVRETIAVPLPDRETIKQQELGQLTHRAWVEALPIAKRPQISGPTPTADLLWQIMDDETRNAWVSAAEAARSAHV